jgi:hypothetical protein
LSAQPEGVEACAVPAAPTRTGTARAATAAILARLAILGMVVTYVLGVLAMYLKVTS